MKGSDIDLFTGTLGKAAVAAGGYVAGSQAAIDSWCNGRPTLFQCIAHTVACRSQGDRRWSTSRSESRSCGHRGLCEEGHPRGWIRRAGIADGHLSDHRRRTATAISMSNRLDLGFPPSASATRSFRKARRDRVQISAA